MEEIIKQIIKGIGDNPDRDGVIDTPKRVIESFKQIYGGYGIDPKSVIKLFPSENSGSVTLSNIDFYSMCEHHMLPFWGKISVQYKPYQHIIGVSKIARLVEVLSRRLQVQERLTREIAETIYEVANPKWVIVECEGQHMCVTSRGVMKSNAIMKTEYTCGQY